MSKLIVVHLRVYRSNGRDSQISYNANGSVQNDNSLVKLRYDIGEWHNFLKNLRSSGYIKVKVEKAMYVGNPKNLIDTTKIKKEVEAAFKLPEAELTPDQKRIADLEAKIEAMAGNTTISKDNGDVEDEAPELTELQKAREKYKEILGKKAWGGWTLEQVNAKIAEAQE